jgi:ferredoxin
MGVVEIDPGACTGCGMCDKRCPTGALAEDVRRDRIAITFDAAACVACGRCVGGCPEIEAGAIRLIPGADPTWLAAGPVELYRDEQVRCEVCGGPVAPAAMLARVRTMLGEGYEKVVDVVSRRCSGCRGVFPSEGSGQPSLLPFIPVGPSRD